MGVMRVSGANAGGLRRGLRQSGSDPDNCVLRVSNAGSVSPVAASMTSHVTPTRNKPSTVST